MKYIISITIAALFFSTSCKKYEEGPAINLTPKKQRVENTWEVYKAYDKDEDVTEDFEQYELKTTKDGDAKLNAAYTFGSITFEYETNGTWEFKDNKENLNFDYEDDEADRDYQILKLTEDEMHLRELGKDLELRLKTK